jgi:hypothetical protein
MSTARFPPPKLPSIRPSNKGLQQASGVVQVQTSQERAESIARMLMSQEPCRRITKKTAGYLPGPSIRYWLIDFGY